MKRQQTYKTMGEAASDPRSSFYKRMEAARKERVAATKGWTAEDWARYVKNYRP